MEAQASLRRYRADGPKISHKINLLAGSTQANDSFHASKPKYNDKPRNFTTSTEAGLALEGMSSSRNSGWQNERNEALDFPAVPRECSKTLDELKSNDRQRMTKGEMRPETSHERKLAGTAREEALAISQNSRKPLQTQPKNNNHRLEQKTRHDPETIK
jgi:hypothetical protein